MSSKDSRTVLVLLLYQEVCQLPATAVRAINRIENIINNTSFADILYYQLFTNKNNKTLITVRLTTLIMIVMSYTLTIYVLY